MSRSQEVYDRVVMKRRTPCPEGRQVGNIGYVYENPAPEWVVEVATVILERTEHLKDKGENLAERALAWCEAAPEPGGRARAFLALCLMLKGQRARQMEAFLDGQGAPPFLFKARR